MCAAVCLCLAACRTVFRSGDRSSDFALSVFAVGTNHILTTDAGHWGTGFLINDDGTIVTANHVILDLLAVVQARKALQPADEAYICVTVFDLRSHTSWTIPMSTVTQRADLDIAVLRPMNKDPWGKLSPPPWKPLAIDSRERPSEGERVEFVGYPNLMPYTPEEGRAFSLRDVPQLAFSQRIVPKITGANIAGFSQALFPEAFRATTPDRTRQSFLLLDHTSVPGNSGGPVISMENGQVLGVVTRGDGRGYSFAVRARDLRTILAALSGQP